ncbi:hypothetical protein FRB94_013242 [Tulasnella sp. JGI-2019a]|nr:hypothetical protein FRB94_013242 [Tulasnella sp. JGI-2019a]
MARSIWFTVALLLVPMASGHPAPPLLNPAPLVRRVIAVTNTTTTSSTTATKPSYSAGHTLTRAASTSTLTSTASTHASTTISTRTPTKTTVRSNATAAIASSVCLSTVAYTTTVDDGSFLASVVPTSKNSTLTGLQLSGTATAVLARSNATQTWQFSGGGLSVAHVDIASCTLHHLWLTLGQANGTYTPLTWSTDKRVTTSWLGGQNQTIRAKLASATGTTLILNFIACKSPTGQWPLYLYTGTPDGIPGHCIETQLLAKTKVTSTIT